MGENADAEEKSKGDIFIMSQKTKRILMAFIGVIVTGFCVGTFQKAILGTDPFTCFVTGIGKIYGSSYSNICVTVGIVFHANVGAGTVITALFMGPVIQWFNTHVSEPLLYGSEKPRA